MTRSDNIFQSLKGRLVVSCQAEPPSPFDSPERVADFARCAVMGGAAGIRTCGIEKARAVLSAVDLPVIALTKSSFPDGTVCITGTMDDVDALVSLGVHVVAVDGTLRLREGALTGPEYIARIRKRHPDQLLMADISTLEEAVLCRAAGADHSLHGQPRDRCADRRRSPVEHLCPRSDPGRVCHGRRPLGSG